MQVKTLTASVGCDIAVAEKWAVPLTRAMARFDISSPARQAAFLAQVAHESQRLSRVEENLNYRADRLQQMFPRYFDQKLAADYARQPQRIASRIYAGRHGNGFEAGGDGWRYRGRGLIQITFRANYRECGLALGVDLEAEPDRLLEPDLAALSAGWFWQKNDLNSLADAGDFRRITVRINGALNGQEDRLALYAMAKAALVA